MQTPTRPFTIGGRTIPQSAVGSFSPAGKSASSSTSNVLARALVNIPASSSSSQSAQQQQQQQKKAVSFRATSVFPSPPAYRTTFGGAQSSSQQQNEPQQQQSYPAQSTSYQPEQQSSLARSTSAPNLLPAPSTAAGNRQVSQSSSQYQQRPQPAQNAAPSPRRTALNTSAVAPVPVNRKLAIEARRTELAKRLRVNLVLLLAWYLVTDSRLYNFLAKEAVQVYPALRTPLMWSIDRLLPLLLLYNASEAFLRIRYGPTSTEIVTSVPEFIPIAEQPVTAPSLAPTSSATPSRMLPINNGTYKSSPKTRPSTNMLPSPSLSRTPRGQRNDASESARAPPLSQGAGTPPRFFRGDATVSESPTSALRRALLASSGSPNKSSPLTYQPQQQDGGMSSSMSMPNGFSGNISPVRENSEASPRVQAYWARHEPLATTFHRSINGRGDIDRLLAGDS